jgi:hypothetical protein
MELRHSGFLRDGGSLERLADIGIPTLFADARRRLTGP